MAILSIGSSQMVCVNQTSFDVVCYIVSRGHPVYRMVLPEFPSGLQKTSVHKMLSCSWWFMVVVVVVALSLRATILGQCLTNQSLPAPFFFFSFLVAITLCTLIPLLRPGSVHSGSAGWNDCGQVFPDELHVSSSPDRFPHNACKGA